MTTKYFVRNDHRCNEYLFGAVWNLNTPNPTAGTIAVINSHDRENAVAIKNALQDKYEKALLLILDGKKAHEHYFEFAKGQIPEGYREVSEEEFLNHSPVSKELPKVKNTCKRMFRAACKAAKITPEVGKRFATKGTSKGSYYNETGSHEFEAHCIWCARTEEVLLYNDEDKGE